MPTMNCKNCGELIDGNFCAHCGQSTSVDTINFKNVISELSGSIFHLNKGLFFTIKALFLRPGHTIREYVGGKRKNHFKPITYAFTLSTLYFLLSQFFESSTFIGEALEGFANGWNDSGKAGNPLVVLSWFVEHYAYTILLLLPLFSLASYLAFLKTGYNYLEHVVLNAYITGQQAIFYSLAVVLSVCTGSADFGENTAVCLSVAYAFIVFWQFFSEQGRVAVVFRSILAYVLFWVMLALATLMIIILTSMM